MTDTQTQTQTQTPVLYFKKNGSREEGEIATKIYHLGVWSIKQSCTNKN